MPISVNSISPFTGPIDGNTLVTITGSNFVQTDQIMLRFSNGSLMNIVSASFVDTQHITCITPEFAMPVVANVSVALNGQQYSEDTVPFSFYVTPVTVISTSPMSGPVSGNTMLDIYGVNFTDTSEIIVRFMNMTTVVYANGTYVSHSHIRCVSPPFPLSTAVVFVDVALNGQQFTSNHVTYYYYGMFDSMSSVVTLFRHS